MLYVRTHIHVHIYTYVCSQQNQRDGKCKNIIILLT